MSKVNSKELAERLEKKEKEAAEMLEQTQKEAAEMLEQKEKENKSKDTMIICECPVSYPSEYKKCPSCGIKNPQY